MQTPEVHPAFVWRFANAEFDERRMELRVGGHLVSIEPRPLDVLLHLLRHAGEVVSKEELLDAVYGHQHISDGALSNAIGKLRRAFGSEQQTVIDTVHRVGYRIVAPVQCAPVDGPPQRLASLKAGDSIPERSHWRLLHPLGAVSGIEVWLAEHQKTSERRVFKFSPDGLWLAALKREVTLYRVIRQVLGERDDFARVLDWNFDTAPFFIECEYGGANLAEWAKSMGGLEAIALEQRLELVAATADAIAAAHSAGVLHKDLKPSNILIDRDKPGQWRPRITDFGCGRLMEPTQLDALGITQMGFTQALAGSNDPQSGTPLYLAPEVLGGQAPTALSDIYSLGVMLYQIVVADFRKIMAPGWEQDVADEVLRQDIAAAAAGNPASRLNSAAELAQRLRSLAARRTALAAERLSATHAAALTQRLDRIRARRPWLIAAGLALAIGFSLSLWNYRVAARARDDARNQAKIAEGVSRFLGHDVLGSSSAYDPAVRKDVTVLQALDRAATHLDGPNKPEPLIEATVRYSLANAYTQMAARPEAEKQAQAAAELYRRLLGPTNPRTLQATLLWLENLVCDSKFEAAEREFDSIDQSPAYQSGIDGESQLLHDVLRGANYYYWERYDQAASYYEKALDEHSRLHPDDIAGLAIRDEMLGLSDLRLGRLADANRLLGQAIELTSSAHDGDEVAVALAQESNAVGLYLQARYAAAEKVLPQVHEVLARDVGLDEQESAESLEYLGLIYLKTGRLSEAESAERSAYQSYLSRYGADNVVTIIAQGHLGMAEFEAGHQAPGLRDLGQAHAALIRLLGSTAPHSQYFQFYLASDTLRSGGKYADVAELAATLQAERLKVAAPDESWPERLSLIQGQSTMAKNN